ncbi:MAG: hypothetical protein L0H53_11365 [Candidatus Nitrosocosmicus sp.]|nr:hypothetical protein [Candidatus Nitrosocosmicus sp.]MDN5866797.1 hypothetical protein [Candidatus Nitrosocosmicus sp.]
MSINQNLRIALKVSCIVFSVLILAQLMVIEPANALTRYFNCVTRASNHNGSFSVDNAEVCYDKVFKGALDNDEFGKPIR